jgi:hypothetical protein
MFRFLKTLLLTLTLALWLGIEPALAFCGFYVGKADTKLYNQASQVIIARQGPRTVLTMANDYQGDAKDFALVVPVPVLLKEEQVKIGDRQILERLDAFSAPRLVEYFDQNPCQIYPQSLENEAWRSGAPAPSARREKSQSDQALGVKVEAKFSVGEYDIVILSAKQSQGLETWLRQNQYRIPSGAQQVLGAYIKQGLKFFVAKVNMREYSRQGYQALRPLMMAYESPKFMLPIRLGMVNAQGPQDLILYLLSPRGATEITNYRTVKIATDVELPEFVEAEFGGFYQALFKRSYQKAGRNVAFLEYAWDMGSCDPCSAEPLNPTELKKAGVFWLDNSRPSSLFITRLHLRYTADKFPEDLQFQSTANQTAFQGRYILRHPYRGESSCDEASGYRRSVRQRQEQEAQTLANLTGWRLEDIYRRISFLPPSPESPAWWRNLWPFR